MALNRATCIVYLQCMHGRLKYAQHVRVYQLSRVGWGSCYTGQLLDSHRIQCHMKWVLTLYNWSPWPPHVPLIALPSIAKAPPPHTLNFSWGMWTHLYPHVSGLRVAWKELPTQRPCWWHWKTNGRKRDWSKGTHIIPRAYRLHAKRACNSVLVVYYIQMLATNILDVSLQYGLCIVSAMMVYIGNSSISRTGGTLVC